MMRGRGIPSGIIAPPPRLCNMSHMPQTLLVRQRYYGETNGDDENDYRGGDDGNEHHHVFTEVHISWNNWAQYVLNMIILQL